MVSIPSGTASYTIKAYLKDFSTPNTNTTNNTNNTNISGADCASSAPATSPPAVRLPRMTA